METKPRFELSIAIQNWSRELATEPNLTPEVCRELETHLRDTVAELQRRGLNDQESFWLARKRIGQPKELREEFVKANPERVWRERVFWISLGLLVVNLWGTAVSAIRIGLIPPLHTRLGDILPQWVLFYLPDRLRDFPGYFSPVIVQSLLVVPLLCFALLLASGKFKTNQSFRNFMFQSRIRFAAICVLAVISLNLINHFLAISVAAKRHILYPSLYETFFSNLFWTLPLILLICFFLPQEIRNSSKQT
jgi:hypothetical protein